MPVARQYVQDNYKDSIGATPDLARFSAAMMFTPFVSVFSHPPDTIKTCLQGDVEQTTYKGYMQTTQVSHCQPRRRRHRRRRRHHHHHHHRHHHQPRTQGARLPHELVPARW